MFAVPLYRALVYRFSSADLLPFVVARYKPIPLRLLLLLLLYRYRSDCHWSSVRSVPFHSVSIFKSFLLNNNINRDNKVFISFIDCWCGGLYRLDNMLEVDFCCICTSFEIGLLLVHRLRIHPRIFPPHQQVRQGKYRLHFLYYLLVRWSLSPPQYPFPWSEVDFCCCRYRYRHVRNRIITGPLSPFPSPPPPVSSISTSTQRSLFGGIYHLDNILLPGRKSIFVVFVPNSKSDCYRFSVSVSIFESFLLINKFDRDTILFISLIVG